MKKIKQNIGNRGQTTLFIIIAIMLIAGIILFFIFLRKPNNKESDRTFEFTNPNSYIQKCVKDSVQEAVGIMLPQGGYLTTKDKISIMYDNINRSYLCYTLNNYRPCVNQDPMYLTSLKNEILTYIKPKINNCFDKLKQNLENENYEINMGEMAVDVELFPGEIRVNLNRDFLMKKGKEAKKFENFDTKVSSRLYDLGIVAQEIASQEAEFCNFETQGYMMFYPDFDINKKIQGRDIQIYLIKHKKTNEELVFAIKSCSSAVGFG